MDLKKFKNLYAKDWRFWYKVFWGTFILLTALIPFILQIVNIRNIVVKNGDQVTPLYVDSNGKIMVWLFLYHTFCFFTLQTNILVGVWFVYAAIYHLQEGKKYILKNNFSIAVAVYITVTSIIAMWYMLPLGMISDALGKGKTSQASANPMGGSIDDGYALYDGINMFLQHLFFPIALILYVVIWRKRDEIKTTKELLKKDVWYYSIYPLIYGTLIIAIGMGIKSNSSIQPILQFPYFWFYIWENGQVAENGMELWPLPNIKIPGAVFTFMTILIIIGIIIGFTILYNYCMRWLEKRDANKANIKNLNKK